MMAAYDRWLPGDDAVLKAVGESGKPVFLVLNKVDRARDKSILLGTIATLAHKHRFEEIFPLSALHDNDFDKLTETLTACLPSRKFIFDRDQLTDRSERFITAELVREKLMVELHRELPYVVHVEVEKFEKRKPVVHISVLIFVQKDSHRAIVIGNDGARMKRVGSRARRELEKLLGKRVFLQLWVKKRHAWQHDAMIVNAYSSDGAVL